MTESVEGTVRDDRISGIVIGRVMNAGNGRPHVMLMDFPEAPVVVALSTVYISSEDVGAEVALSFENGDPQRPLILGRVLRASKGQVVEERRVAINSAAQDVDLTAERQITLRCGKASITLTREGKIILRGTYISSRSSGVNRIKGGSVQIN